MPAVEVTPCGALPEEVIEFMDFYFVVPEKPEKERIHRLFFANICRIFLFLCKLTTKEGFTSKRRHHENLAPSSQRNLPHRSALRFPGLLWHAGTAHVSGKG
jgi:hypothetical protein